MNVKRLHKLADFMEKAEYGFNMSDPDADPKCGTAGCIAGHAAVLWPSLREYHEDESNFTWSNERLTAFLDISYEQHEELCFISSGLVLLGEVTRSVAVAAVRRLADTGEVEFRLTD